MKNSPVILAIETSCDETAAAVYENEKGLYVEGRIFLNLNLGREAYILIQNKVTDHLSIGYEVLDFYYHGDIRCITKIKLWEVSVVTFPANEFAEIVALAT